MSDKDILPDDEREIRAGLGLESTYGYHIVRPLTNGDGDDEDDDEGLAAWAVIAAVAAREEPEPPVTPWDSAAVSHPEGAEVATKRPGHTRQATLPYPCLQGTRYSGCVGMGCPLITCWTGTPTPSALAHGAHATPSGTVVYLGHILCHRCTHVMWALPKGRTGAATRTRALTCAQGKWRSAVSPGSFATRHIPLEDDVEPLDCPAFEDSGSLHPEVVAYRGRHRLAMRAYRARLHDPDPGRTAPDEGVDQVGAVRRP